MVARTHVTAGAEPMVCSARATPPRQVRSVTHEAVHFEPQAVAGGRGEIFVAGEPVIVYDAAGIPVVERRVTGGIIRAATGRFVPAPLGDTALGAPVISGDGHGSWDAIWMRSQSRDSTRPVRTFFHARFDGRVWESPEPVDTGNEVSWGPGINSSISRSGKDLAIAAPILGMARGGTVAVVLRRDGQWKSELVPTGTGSGSAYASVFLQNHDLLLAYVSGGMPPKGGGNALFVRGSVNGHPWSTPVQLAERDVYEPQLLPIGRSRVLLVWEQLIERKGVQDREAWLARGRVDGSGWERPTRLLRAPGLDSHIALAPIADNSVLALVELGGPIRREQRLLRIDDQGAVELFRDSVNAATRALLAPIAPHSAQAIWSSTRQGQALIPESFTRTFSVTCDDAHRSVNRPSNNGAFTWQGDHSQ